MNENEYQCAACEQVFEKGWSDEKALEETERLFPGYLDSEAPTSIVCDACFRMLMGLPQVH